MKTYYFTFGQTHVHSVNGFTYDKDVVVQINAENSNNAREIMFKHFGKDWAFQHMSIPNMNYFPRGVKVLNPPNKEEMEFGQAVMDQLNEHDLREVAHYYGSWDELRKVIDRLEENDKIAASERSQDPTRI